MDYTGKTQLTVTIVSPAELENEGDRIFKSHAEWMKRIHYRDGDKALLQYNVTKSAEEDGKITYVLVEVYRSAAGLQDHFDRSGNWDSHEDFGKWTEKCEVIWPGPFPSVIHSLW